MSDPENLNCSVAADVKGKNSNGSSEENKLVDEIKVQDGGDSVSVLEEGEIDDAKLLAFEIPDGETNSSSSSDLKVAAVGVNVEDEESLKIKNAQVSKVTMEVDFEDDQTTKAMEDKHDNNTSVNKKEVDFEDHQTTKAMEDNRDSNTSVNKKEVDFEDHQTTKATEDNHDSKTSISKRPRWQDNLSDQEEEEETNNRPKNDCATTESVTNDNNNTAAAIHRLDKTSTKSKAKWQDNSAQIESSDGGREKGYSILAKVESAAKPKPRWQDNSDDESNSDSSNPKPNPKPKPRWQDNSDDESNSDDARESVGVDNVYEESPGTLLHKRLFGIDNNNNINGTPTANTSGDTLLVSPLVNHESLSVGTCVSSLHHHPNEMKDGQIIVDNGSERNNGNASEEGEGSDIEEGEDLSGPEAYYPAMRGCRDVNVYECLNRIDEGQYGVVYRAKDKKTDEVVALKRLKMEKEREGFPITSLREINCLLKAQHKNIVNVREIVVGSGMDDIYIVMEYVEHDLKALIQDVKEPFKESETKMLLSHLLSGVAFMHDNWILHRDLKTSNLLLSDRGILKIGDFGLAREYGDPIKKYTPLVVTLWYRCPELLLGATTYSRAVDMWAVGCIFGELLLKETMFQGRSEMDQLQIIFKLLGKPNTHIWPGYDELPNAKMFRFPNQPYSLLKEKFPFLGEQGIDMMKTLLMFDPTKRISADDALRHDYFRSHPLPIHHSMFPTFPAKSKGEKRHSSPPAPAPHDFSYDTSKNVDGIIIKEYGTNTAATAASHQTVLFKT